MLHELDTAWQEIAHTVEVLKDNHPDEQQF